MRSSSPTTLTIGSTVSELLFEFSVCTTIAQIITDDYSITIFRQDYIIDASDHAPHEVVSLYKIMLFL